VAGWWKKQPIFQFQNTHTMKKWLCLGILFICSTLVTAQNFAWASSFGANAQDVGVSIAIDASGNVYTMGTYSGTVDFDPGPGVFNLSSAGAVDIFVLKMDPAGNFIWAKSIGGSVWASGRGMVLDNFGSLYITGYFISTVDFDPSPASYTLSSTGGSIDVFILKLDLSGNLIWVNSVGGINNDFVYCISLSNLGYVYISGTYNGNVDFNPSPGGTFLLPAQSGTFILKLDMSGNFAWAKHVDHAIAALDVDSQDNLYMSGPFNNQVDFDPGPGTFTIMPNILADAYICKFDSPGNFVWARKIGGPDVENVHALKVDGFNNVYISGYFGDVADFDPGPGTYTLNAGMVSVSPFICKLSSVGNFIWAKHLLNLAPPGFPNYKLQGLAIDSNANVFLGGGFTGTLDFDPGPGSYTFSSNGSQDIFVLKLDASGNFNQFYSTGGAGADYANSLCLSSAGDVYVTGTYSGTVDFDPGQAVSNLSSVSNDVFILKLNGPDVGLYENASENLVTIYPNPVRDKLTVSKPSIQGTGFYIRDLLGRPVLTGQLDDQNQVDVAQLPAGAYLLQVGSIHRPFKLIKQ
jgi:hypothetical protein